MAFFLSLKKLFASYGIADHMCSPVVGTQADKITVDNPFDQSGIRPSIDVGRYLCSSLLVILLEFLLLTFYNSD